MTVRPYPTPLSCSELASSITSAHIGRIQFFSLHGVFQQFLVPLRFGCYRLSFFKPRQVHFHAILLSKPDSKGFNVFKGLPMKPPKSQDVFASSVHRGRSQEFESERLVPLEVVQDESLIDAVARVSLRDEEACVASVSRVKVNLTEGNLRLFY